MLSGVELTVDTRYVRDLIAGLQDNENHDRFELCLSTAASLITRKAEFGKEVTDAAGELASLLIGLRDPFEIEDFETERRAALAALLLATPAKVVAYYTEAYWYGDYSANQRVTVLQAIGLAAQRLSGWGTEISKETSFASEKLSERLHGLYLGASGDSSKDRRLKSPQNVTVRGKRQTRVIRNDLAQIVAEQFFFPLLNGWALKGQGSSQQSSVLMPPFIQTLNLLIRMSGKTSRGLEMMLTEFWRFLQMMRSKAMKDKAVLDAVLSGLLTVFDLSDDKRMLAERHGRELIDTFEWVNTVFEASSDADEESARLKTLAAALLVAVRDVVESYQRLLLGDMVGNL